MPFNDGIYGARQCRVVAGLRVVPGLTHDERDDEFNSFFFATEQVGRIETGLFSFQKENGQAVDAESIGRWGALRFIIEISIEGTNGGSRRGSNLQTEYKKTALHVVQPEYLECGSRRKRGGRGER